MANTPEIRSIPVAIRLTPDEKARLEKAAAAKQRTLSDWIRLTCLAAAKRVR